jgi:tRNA(Arg) A34 adenosine deaminase TadA
MTEFEPEGHLAQHSIVAKTSAYLKRTKGRYKPGQDEYYARTALRQAARALSYGNYGIGAVAVLVDSTIVSEYWAGNAMVTGLGVVDHAETQAVLAAKRGLVPSACYPRSRNQHTRDLPTGLSVFGTLEPCPMCACVLANAGAVRSVSTVPDGEPTWLNKMLVGSDGAATVIGPKCALQPHIWQDIQARLGLRFVQLATADRKLFRLSDDIFKVNRDQLDHELFSRTRGRPNDGPRQAH